MNNAFFKVQKKQMGENTEKKIKLSFFEKVSYGIGDTASCLLWQTFSLYLLFFYTDIFSLNAAAVGFMIFLVTSLNAVIDPVIGIIADRTNTRWGKFRPYILWFAAPLAVATFFTFSTQSFSYSGKLLYAYITYGLMMVLFSVVNIPYSSLLGVLTSDSVERTSLSSFKFIGAYVGGFIVSSTVLPMTKYIGGEQNLDHGWQITIAILAVIVIGLYMFTFAFTKERIQPSSTKKTLITRDLWDLITNAPWLILLFVSFSMILFVAFRMNITIYYFKYFVIKQMIWGKNYGFEELTSAFNTIGMFFSILGTIIVSRVVGKLGKKDTFLIYFATASVINTFYFFLRSSDIVAIFALQIISSFFSGPLSPLIWAMYADTADYSEWKNNRRATGLVFSAAIMVQKFGWAIGAAIIGALLSGFGFSPNMEQNDIVKNLICYLMGVVPSIIGVISIIIVMFYKLDDKTMKTIGKELTERR